VQEFPLDGECIFAGQETFIRVPGVMSADGSNTTTSIAIAASTFVVRPH
jgi:hypothetical protein